MKKILAVILSLCLLCGTVAVAAELTPSSQSQSIQVQYTVVEPESTYTVTIPASFTLTKSDGNDYAEYTANVSIDATEYYKTTDRIDVTLTGTSYSDSAFYLSNGSSALSYTITNNTDSKAVASGDVVLSWNSSSETVKTKTTELYWKTGSLTGAAAGDYTDTLTFTVSVENLAGSFDGPAVKFPTP